MNSNGALGAHRHRAIWVVVIPLGLWALIRTLGLDGATPIAFLLAFTPLVAVAAVFATGIAVALRNWIAAIVAALVAITLCGLVLPRAFGSAESPPPGSDHLDVISSNVYIGQADPAALVSLVRRYDPDLLAVQELTSEFDRKLRAAGVLRLLPFSSLSFQLPTDGGRGIYSKLPIRRISGRRTAVIATLPSGRSIRVFNVHPHTPQPGGTDVWRDSLRRLPSAGTGMPWVLLGDFNATLDHSALRDVLDRGYRDAGEETGQGLISTWPAGKAIPPLVTIDHVFADERLGIGGYGVDDLPGSDHRTIHAELFVPPSK